MLSSYLPGSSAAAAAVSYGANSITRNVPDQVLVLELSSAQTPRMREMFLFARCSRLPSVDPAERMTRLIRQRLLDPLGRLFERVGQAAQVLLRPRGVA